MSNEQNAEALKNRALEFFEDGKLEEALETSSESLRLQENAAILIIRSKIYLEMKNPLMAYMDACQALEFNIVLFDARFQKALALRNIGRFIEARRDFEMCRRIRPQYQSVIDALAELDALENELSKQVAVQSDDLKSLYLNDTDYYKLILSDDLSLRALYDLDNKPQNFREFPGCLRYYCRKICRVTFLKVNSASNLMRYVESVHPTIFTGVLSFQDVNFGSPDTFKRLFNKCILPDSLEIDDFQGIDSTEFSMALQNCRAFHVITRLTFLKPNAGFRIDANAILSFLHHHSTRKEKIFYLHLAFLDMELGEFVELCRNKFESDNRRSLYMLRVVCPAGTKIPQHRTTFNRNTEEMMIVTGGDHCPPQIFSNRAETLIEDAMLLDIVRQSAYHALYA